MKKTVSIILSLIVMLSLTITGCAAENDAEQESRKADLSIILQIDNPIMKVNGEEKAIDESGTTPVIVNDRTLVPIRAIIENMGGIVGWNGEANEVTLNYGDDEIRLVIDSTTAYLNNEPNELDTAPAIINERTMLPIRFIAESFKFDVAWNGASEIITIARGTVDEKEQPTDKKSAVIYFSCTNNTKKLAEKIAAATNSDIFEIVPSVPYTSADLNYNSDCRANREQNDDTARPEIAVHFELDNYDTVYLGYPIWWGTMPKIINTFLETYDLSEKNVMPFCTSGSSGISTSVNAIRKYLPDVKEGMRGTTSTTETEIKEWIEKNQ